MSELEVFLKKTDKVLGTPSEADITAVKDTLEALRKVSPDLIDSKIFERLSRLVNSAEIARDTQKQVNKLGFDIKNLQIQQKNLRRTLQDMKESFDGLEHRLEVEANYLRSFRKKVTDVLEGLDGWLRRHS